MTSCRKLEAAAVFEKVLVSGLFGLTGPSGQDRDFHMRNGRGAPCTAEQAHLDATSRNIRKKFQFRDGRTATGEINVSERVAFFAVRPS